MSIVRETVVFDANVYRELAGKKSWQQVFAKAAKLRDMERARSIRAKASPITLLELIAHLGDEDSDEAMVCQKALGFLAEHVKDHEDGSRLHVINSSANIVAIELFGQRIANEDLAKKRLAAVALCFAAQGPLTLSPDLAVVVANAKEGKRLDEERWYHFHGRLAHIESNADDFAWNWAEALVTTYAAIAGVLLTTDQAGTHQERALELFQIPLAFTRQLYANHKHATEPGRRWPNHMWDLDLTYLFGPHHRLDGVPVLLVTSDGQLRAAAIGIGHENHVLVKDAYYEHLRGC